MDSTKMTAAANADFHNSAWSEQHGTIVFQVKFFKKFKKLNTEVTKQF